MKKSIKKSIASLLITLTLAVGAVSVPTQANAGIIIAVIPGTGLIGAVVGLTLCSAGFFKGMQVEDLDPLSAVLFILDEKPKADQVDSMISQRYPELDAALVQELSGLIIQKSNTLEFNDKKIKDVILLESEISSVLNILSNTNPTLGEKIRSDLTQSSFKN